MTTDNNSTNNNPDTLGIYTKLIIILHKFYVDIRKNIAVFLLCVIATTALFLTLNIKKSNSYSASFTVVYEELVRKVYGDRLEKLDLLLQSNKPKAQQILGLNDAAIASLKEISATNILGEDLSKDMNTDKIPFIVNISITDTSYILTIQKSIISYLENGNAYLIDKRKLKFKEIENELAFIDRQLNMMDTLKSKYYDDQSVGKSDKNSDVGSSVYEISYELYKKRQELAKKLEMPMNLYVIDDAIVPSKNNKPMLLILFAGMVVGFVAYMFIAYIVLPVVRYKES